MFPAMFRTAMELNHSLFRTPDGKNKLNVKIVSCRYIFDMLFTSMYKVDPKTAAESNHHFLDMAHYLLDRTQTVVRFNFWLQQSPKLAFHLGGRVIDQKAQNYYKHLLELMKLREETDTSDDDLIQYFLNSAKSREFNGNPDEGNR